MPRADATRNTVAVLNLLKKAPGLWRYCYCSCVHGSLGLAVMLYFEQDFNVCMGMNIL